MSILGAVVGFGASQLVGMVWYSPLMFGNTWVGLVFPGKNHEELKKGAGPAFVVSMLSHAALAFGLNHFYIDHMGVTSMSLALRAGLALSGLVAISDICHVMFAKRPWMLFVIDQGFNAAVIMAISAGIGFFL